MSKEMENREEVIARLKEAARDGRISCAAARKIAEICRYLTGRSVPYAIN